MLWSNGTISSFSEGCSIELLVCESIHEDESGNCQATSKGEAEERQANLSQIKAVNAFKNDGKRVEEGKDHSKIESNVETEEAHNGFGDEHTERSKECHCQQEFECGSTRGPRFGDRDPKTFGPTLKYGLLVGFAHEGGEEVARDREKK